MRLKKLALSHDLTVEILKFTESQEIEFKFVIMFKMIGTLLLSKGSKKYGQFSDRTCQTILDPMLVIL